MDTTAMILLPLYIAFIVTLVSENFFGSVFRFFFGPWPTEDRTRDRTMTRVIGLLALCLMLGFLLVMGWNIWLHIAFPTD